MARQSLSPARRRLPTQSLPTGPAPTGASPQVPMGVHGLEGGGWAHTQWLVPSEARSAARPGTHWTQCSHLHGPRPWTPAPLYRGQRRLLGTPGRRRDRALSRGRVSACSQHRRPCRPSSHSPPGQQGPTSPGTSGSDPRAHPATRRPLRRGVSWPVLRLSARSAGRPGTSWVTLLLTPRRPPEAWPGQESGTLGPSQERSLQPGWSMGCPRL